MKIALYLRVSTDVQDYNRQLSDLSNLAKKQGNEVAYIFKDKISGFKDDKNRPELNQLLQLTKADIDAVYISEFSRLSRNPTYLKVLIDDFTAKGINVYSFSQNINTIEKNGEESLATRIAISIYAEYSKYEIDLKNLRQKSGKKESVRVKGNSYTSKPPYGYTKQDKKLVILEREAENVRYIFEKYAAGSSIKEIVQYLNLNNVPTRNTDFMKKSEFKVNRTKTISKDEILWGKSSVRNILRNTAYYGVKVLKGGDAISVPAIITEELFNKCADGIKERITCTDKTRKNDFMLRGFFYCGECGKQYLGTKSHQFLLYTCSDKRNRRSLNATVGCKNTAVSKDNIEPVIWSAVKGAYANYRSIQIKEGNIASYNRIIEDSTEQIEAVETGLSNLQKESDRLLSLYIKGLYKEAALDKEQKRINAEIESLNRLKRTHQAKISEAKETLAAISTIDDKPYNLNEIDKSYQLQKEAVKELVKQVIIYKVDNKYTVFQINFKAGYSYYIIREVWTKKYQILEGDIYTFNSDDKTFTFSGMAKSEGLHYEPATVTKSAIDLFNELEQTKKVEELAVLG